MNIFILFAFMKFIFVNADSKFTSWVDPDTPKSLHITKSKILSSNDDYELVFSDEFNQEGRNFHDGEDPKWTAINKSDDDQNSGGKKSLQFYNSSMVSTSDGKLVIKTTTENTEWKQFNPYKKKYETMKRTFKSGMVMGWNKFCFTGEYFLNGSSLSAVLLVPVLVIVSLFLCLYTNQLPLFFINLHLHLQVV